MTKDDLGKLLDNLKPAAEYVLNYDMFADLFPPGYPDQGAMAKLQNFARSHRCYLSNEPAEEAVWFIKHS
jgi:hypothetical protein